MRRNKLKHCCFPLMIRLSRETRDSSALWAAKVVFTLWKIRSRNKSFLLWFWFYWILQMFWAQHRFSAFWLRSKCSICSYQLNIWYGGHVPPSILNWFLQGDEVQELAPASSRVGLALQHRQDRLTPHFPMRFLQCDASLIPIFRMGLSRLAVDWISKRLLRPSPQVL